jgi:hypothetical protein
VSELFSNPAFYVVQAINLIVGLVIFLAVKSAPKLKAELAEVKAKAEATVLTLKVDAQEVQKFVAEAQAAAQKPEAIEAPTQVLVASLLEPTPQPALAPVAPLAPPVVAPVSPLDQSHADAPTPGNLNPAEIIVTDTPTVQVVAGPVVTSSVVTRADGSTEQLNGALSPAVPPVSASF